MVSEDNLLDLTTRRKGLGMNEQQKRASYTKRERRLHKQAMHADKNAEQYELNIEKEKKRLAKRFCKELRKEFGSRFTQASGNTAQICEEVAITKEGLNPRLGFTKGYEYPHATGKC